MLNKKKNFLLKGISLVETMVALGVLLVGILSSYFLLMRTLSSYRFIEDRLFAANLAQKKIEEIRQIRDNNYANWYDEYVRNRRSWQWNRNINCNYIKCDETINNKFRMITNLGYRSNNKELVITVTVSWQTKGQNFSLTAESHLYDWANLPSR